MLSFGKWSVTVQSQSAELPAEAVNIFHLPSKGEEFLHVESSLKKGQFHNQHWVKLLKLHASDSNPPPRHSWIKLFCKARAGRTWKRLRLNPWLENTWAGETLSSYTSMYNLGLQRLPLLLMQQNYGVLDKSKIPSRKSNGNSF